VKNRDEFKLDTLDREHGPSKIGLKTRISRGNQNRLAIGEIKGYMLKYLLEFK
jgi:hypothetical protein